MWDNSRAHHAVTQVSSYRDIARKAGISGAHLARDFRDPVSGERDWSNSGSGLWSKKFWSWQEGQSYENRPRISCWRFHSTGKSRKLATPMPRGSRPSTAAWTSVGARKASVIVRLTCLILQVSRCAICSTFGTVPAINSSSQHRPAAIAVISLARVSARIGRRSAGDAVGDRAMICHGGLAGFFFHGMRRVVALG